MIRKCSQASLGVSSKAKLFSAHALEKKGMGGTGSSWQQCLKKLKTIPKELPLGLLWGPPVQQEWGTQAGIGASCRGVGLLRQFSLARSQPHAVSFCSILSRTELPCPCQKPDSSPVRFVFLLILLCLQTDSIHRLALHSN